MRKGGSTGPSRCPKQIELVVEESETLRKMGVQRSRGLFFRAPTVEEGFQTFAKGKVVFEWSVQLMTKKVFYETAITRGDREMDMGISLCQDGQEYFAMSADLMHYNQRAPIGTTNHGQCARIWYSVNCGPLYMYNDNVTLRIKRTGSAVRLQYVMKEHKTISHKSPQGERELLWRYTNDKEPYFTPYYRPISPQEYCIVKVNVNVREEGRTRPCLALVEDVGNIQRVKDVPIFSSGHDGDHPVHLRLKYDLHPNGQPFCTQGRDVMFPRGSEYLKLPWLNERTVQYVHAHPLRIPHRGGVKFSGQWCQRTNYLSLGNRRMQTLGQKLQHECKEEIFCLVCMRLESTVGDEIVLCDGKGGTCEHAAHWKCMKLHACPTASEEWLCPHCEGPKYKRRRTTSRTDLLVVAHPREVGQQEMRTTALSTEHQNGMVVKKEKLQTTALSAEHGRVTTMEEILNLFPKD